MGNGKPMALPAEIVRAVRRYQRNLVEEARRMAIVEAEGWSDEVLRRVRPVITARARDKALEHLKEVLLADGRPTTQAGPKR